MVFFRTFSFYLTAWTGFLAAATPLVSSIQIRNAPEDSVQDTYVSIRHALNAASLEKRDNYKTWISLEKTWNEATLLSVAMARDIPQNSQNRSLEVHAGIEVTCTTCYILGNATAELVFDEGFNVSRALEQTVNDVGDKFMNFGEQVGDYLKNYTDDMPNKFGDGFDWADLDFPTFPYAFDLDVPETPACTIRFEFNDMELYLEMNTVLNAGATYEINLYSTASPFGFRAGSMLQLGFVLSVDLILAVDGEIDISSGFHIKLDDGVAIDIALFGDKVSNLVLYDLHHKDLTILSSNGGQFEFLPVTIESAEVVISAALRIGVSCGMEVGTPKVSGVIGALAFDVKAGIEVAVFANLAEFITNITRTPDDNECGLKVVQEYNLVLGAVAGASIEIDAIGVAPQTWGPVIEGSTAIFTTSLAEACAIQRTAKPTQNVVSAVGEKRDDLETVTLVKEVTTTGVSCTITGIGNCPVSAQSSTKAVITKTHITAISSGNPTPAFPESTFDIVRRTVPFGKAVNSIRATSGSPTAYTAPPTSANHLSINGEVAGVSRKTIIGVSVGLGVPILLVIVGALVFYKRRRNYTAVTPMAPAMVADPHKGEAGYRDDIKSPRNADVDASEVQH